MTSDDKVPMMGYRAGVAAGADKRAGAGLRMAQGCQTQLILSQAVHCSAGKDGRRGPAEAEPQHCPGGHRGSPTKEGFQGTDCGKPLLIPPHTLAA